MEGGQNHEHKNCTAVLIRLTEKQIDFRQERREQWPLKRCPDRNLYQVVVFWTNLRAFPHLKCLNPIEVFGVGEQAGRGSGLE